MAEDARIVQTLPVANGLLLTDQLVCVQNVAASNTGGNVSIITLQNLFGNSQVFLTQQADPANATANSTITQGTVFFSNTFGYVAIANGVLRKWAVSSF